MKPSQQTCVRCVMDESASDISFDATGVCSYCTAYLRDLEVSRGAQKPGSADLLAGLIQEIKCKGQGKSYDCVIGLSGGLDSAWTLYQAVKRGLRPLAVHMDNGWNSELAQNNIENLVRKLKVDLFTYVIDWPEYRALMQACFDADVIDVELLYDNAMLKVNYAQAAKHGIRYILAGTNIATEGMRMPPGWNWYKFDKKNIRAIGARSKISIRTFPAISTFDRIWYTYGRGIRWVSFLDYLDYKKSEAIQVLTGELGYKPYPYKHYESVFTRFYQGYILPRKFGVDKRRLHLSTLIVSGQLSRGDALRQMAESPYPSEADLEMDKKYFMKKMGWSEDTLKTYLSRPPRAHDDFGSEKALKDFLVAAFRRIQKN